MPMPVTILNPVMEAALRAEASAQELVRFCDDCPDEAWMAGIETLGQELAVRLSGGACRRVAVLGQRASLGDLDCVHRMGMLISRATRRAELAERNLIGKADDSDAAMASNVIMLGSAVLGLVAAIL